MAGTKLFKSDSLDGTMDDVTGTATISSDANNLRDLFVFNDLLIGMGAGDAPFKYAGGAGSAADLGGSPPSATGGFTYNNRVFGYTGSQIYWSVVFREFEIFRDGFEKDGRKIYNATVGGKLEVFERKKIEDIIK